MDYHYAKFDDFSFSRFGFIVQRHIQRESCTDADDRYTHVTVVGVSTEAGHSTQCITHTGHSIAFLHFIFDPVTSTFDLLT